MSFIKFFKDIDKNSVSEAGGKGASLGEMTQANAPVPPGFVILSAAFDRFLDEAGLTDSISSQLGEVDYKDVNSVESHSNAIRDKIMKAEMPADLAKDIQEDFKKLGAKFVAVRSSATAEDSSAASWAGELDTYLHTTEKNLIHNIQSCWASLFTPRAIFYRNEKKLLDTKVSVAVVIQKMMESEVSGIAFTVHPVTQDRNQMIIEAGYGLGEAVVSGAITPDSYVLDKTDLSLIDINISEQSKYLKKGVNGGVEWADVSKDKKGLQKLTGQQIVELGKICIGIEKHYGFPCDIEWLYVEGKIYITQSRPITTL